MPNDNLKEGASQPFAAAPGSPIGNAAAAARQWCRNHPGWEPICDMASTDHLYVRWGDLTKSQKLSWRNRFGDSAEDAFAEATHPCKVETGWVDENGRFSDSVPFGTVGMMVFHSANSEVSGAGATASNENTKS